MKIAFVGPREYHRSLELLGFESFAVKSKKEALDLIKKLKSQEFGLVFASQDVLDEECPGVVILPGLVKKQKVDYLKNIIKKAIGKEIKLE